MRHRFWKSRLLNYTVPDTSGYDILLLIQTLQLWILCYSLGAELVLPQLHRGASLISSTLLNQYVFPFLWFFILLLLHFPLIPNLFLFSPWFFPLRSLSSLQPAQFLHFLRLCEFYLCNSSLFPSVFLEVNQICSCSRAVSCVALHCFGLDGICALSVHLLIKFFSPHSFHLKKNSGTSFLGNTVFM